MERVASPPSIMQAMQAGAEEYLPGGVSASGRYNPSLGHTLFVRGADGPWLHGVDGVDYIDFNLSHGAAFLGHNHPVVRQAVLEALELGVYAGYETEFHTELARRVVETIPCAEKVRFSNTGSEGTLTTLRMARAFTGKKKLLKFWGHFHGMHDYVMFNAHSPLERRGPSPYLPLLAESAGIPPELAELVIVIPWKDEAALEQAVREHGHEIAAVMMEPINYNQGCIVASREYMQFVRQICSANDIVLIYDEVLSAFRTGPDCAQGYYGVKPDLCVLGKAVANGAPMVILAGRTDVMNTLSPVGAAAHSGTFTGNLISVKVALASFAEVNRPNFYQPIYASADRLYRGLNQLFAQKGVAARAQGLGARFGLFFGFTEPVETFEDTFKHDDAMAGRFIRACAGRGVYFHGYGKLVRGHHGISAAHTLPIIDEALNRIEDAVTDMLQGGG
jgi:glutamate-1-semialdehyde 2,1-aminomutase